MNVRLILIGILGALTGWSVPRAYLLGQENATLRDQLAKEIKGCNAYVNWLDRCLDGRTCTVAGDPPFKPHRLFPVVTLPNNVVPWEQACMRAGGWNYLRPDLHKEE